MPYKIELYKSVLDKYLHSGIKFIKYTRQLFGETKVFFPYISTAQISEYVHNRQFMSGGRVHYRTSMPYSTWKWFLSNFDIQGINKIDSCKNERYFVMIIEGRAVMIQLTAQNFPMQELAHRAVYSVQHKFLNKAVERVCKNGFYRCIFTHEQFAYHDKVLSFEQMVKVAQDVDYVGDNLFVDYIKGVDVNDVYDVLRHVQERYAKGNKGTTYEQNRKDWAGHTKQLFESVNFSTPEEEAVRLEIIAYCNGIKKTDRPSTVQVETTRKKNHFTKITRTKAFIGRLYSVLKSKGALDMSTKEEDFLYYLKGEGNRPTVKLQWRTDLTHLVLLIDELCGGFPQWAVASRVFEEVAENTLKSTFSRLIKQDNFNERKEDIRVRYIKPAQDY